LAYSVLYIQISVTYRYISRELCNALVLLVLQGSNKSLLFASL
jgi:hypothetical protein